MAAVAVANLVGITVCINYSDFLKRTLAENRKYFADYYLVTEEADKETIAVGEAHACKIILFSEKNARGAKFNKSGMVLAAQKIAHEEHPEKWICLLDADILLGSDMAELDVSKLDKVAIYGANRKLYETQKDYESGKAKLIVEKIKDPIGFFQLYWAKSKFKLYRPWSYSCAECDMDFMRAFDRKIKLEHPTCYHLGFMECNWNGRVTEKWTST